MDSLRYSEEKSVVSHENSSKSVCPVTNAALVLGSKWDLVIINHLLKNSFRFNELKDKISKALDKPLTAASLSRILKKLEKSGIVERVIKSPIGENIEISYKLTKMGYDLESTLNELKDWGTKYLI